MTAAPPLPRCKFGPLGSLGVDAAKLRQLPRLATFMAADPAPPPPAFSYLTGVTSWGMMHNDQIGCCEIATAGHLIMGWSNASAGTPAVVTDDQVVAAYSAVCGYDPATGENDNGCQTADVLNYWQSVGIAGNKCGGYVAIDPTNHLEVMQAIYLFGGVFVTIALPKSAEEQTDAGQPWTPSYWSPNLGGHAITYQAFGSAGVTGITWGQEQK